VGTRQQRVKSTCPSTHLTFRPTIEATPIVPARRVSNVWAFGILGNCEHACQAGAFRTLRIGNDKSASVALTVLTTQPARGRCCRSLHCEAVAYSLGIARSFGRSHAQAETVSAQAPRRLRDTNGHTCVEVVRSSILQATFRAFGLHHAPDDLGTESGVLNALGLIGRPKYWTLVTPAAFTQLSTAPLTQVGTGTVRI